jgi:PAS domain S-box-containing protein
MEYALISGDGLAEMLTLITVTTAAGGTWLARKLRLAASHDSRKDSSEAPPFLNMLNCFHLGACLINHQGKVLWINQNAQRLCNCGTEKGYCWRLHNSDDHSPHDNPLHRALHEGLASSATAVNIKCADGAVRSMRESALPIFNTSQQARTALVIHADNTDRRDIEEELQRSKHLQHKIFASTSLGIGIVDLTGQLVEANDALCAMLGYSRQELLAKSFRDISCTEEQPREELLLTAMLQGKLDNYHIEKKYWHRNGHSIDVDINVSPIHDLDGNISSIIGLVTDITAHKAAEHALLQRKKSLDKAQRIARLGSWTYSPADDVLTVSDQFRSILRIRDGAPVHYADFRQLCHPADQAQLASALPNLGERCSASYNVAYRLRLSNGECRDVIERGEYTPSGNDDEWQLVGTLQDITDSRMIEKKLLDFQESCRRLSKHQQKIREQERKHIALELHDELGQQLTAIRFSLSMLRMNFSGMDGLESAIESIKEQINQAIVTTQQVATDLRPAALNLGLIPALEWLARTFHERTGIAASLRVMSNTVELDDEHSTTIFRIVQESLTNVMRYARADNVKIKLSKGKTDLRLVIQDDGCGFDVEATQEHSFGLLGIRERAQALGGEVVISSALGQGTSISLKIPLEQKP